MRSCRLQLPILDYGVRNKMVYKKANQDHQRAVNAAARRRSDKQFERQMKFLKIVQERLGQANLRIAQIEETVFGVDEEE